MTESASGVSLGFVGLGAMGYPMAANLAAGARVAVWNRTGAVAARHAEEHGTTAVADLEALKGCALIALCVPTSSVSSIICERLVPVMTSTHAVTITPVARR